VSLRVEKLLVIDCDICGTGAVEYVVAQQMNVTMPPKDAVVAFPADARGTASVAAFIGLAREAGWLMDITSKGDSCLCPGCRKALGDGPKAALA